MSADQLEAAALIAVLVFVVWLIWRGTKDRRAEFEDDNARGMW